MAIIKLPPRLAHTNTHRESQFVQRSYESVGLSVFPPSVRRQTQVFVRSKKTFTLKTIRPCTLLVRAEIHLLRPDDHVPKLTFRRARDLLFEGVKAEVEARQRTRRR